MNLQINTTVPWRPHDNLVCLHEPPNQHHSPLTTPRQLELSTWIPWRPHDNLGYLHEPPSITVPWRPHDNLSCLHEPPNQHRSPLTTNLSCLHEPPNQHHSPLTTPGRLHAHHSPLSCLHEPPNTTPRQLELTPGQFRLSTWTSRTPQSPDDPTTTWVVYMNLQINTIVPWQPLDNLSCLHEPPNQHHSPLTTPGQFRLSTWTSKSTPHPTTTWAVYMNLQINITVPWGPHDNLGCLHERPNQHRSPLTSPRPLELPTWTSKSTPQSPDDPTTTWAVYMNLQINTTIALITPDDHKTTWAPNQHHGPSHHPWRYPWQHHHVLSDTGYDCRAVSRRSMDSCRYRWICSRRRDKWRSRSVCQVPRRRDTISKHSGWQIPLQLYGRD